MGALGNGSLFRRESRCTGRALPTWHLSYSVTVRLPDGSETTRQKRESAKTTDREVALALLRQRVGASSNGVPERRDVTVRDVLAKLVAAYKSEGKSSWRNVQSNAKYVNAIIGDERASDVTTEMLRSLMRDWKREGASPATCNRRIQNLETAYNRADLIVDPQRLKFRRAMLKEKPERARYIPREAMDAIYEHTPDADLRDFYEVRYLLGKRHAQFLSTRWTWVERATWTVQWPGTVTKSGEPETLVLRGVPLTIFKRRWKVRRPDCDLVFHRDGKPIVDVRKAWARACKAAGFPIGRKNGGYEMRAFRHSAFTNLVNAGVPVHEAMLITGHRTMSVVRRYSLNIREQQIRALEAVSAEHTKHRRKGRGGMDCVGPRASDTRMRVR